MKTGVGHLILALSASFPFICAGVECIAHRGFSAQFRENTIEAVQKAWDENADLVEVDLRLTKDKQVVLFHDESVSEKRISALNYDEVQSLTPKFHVPTLDEIIPECSTDRRLLLDFKDESSELVNLVVLKIKTAGDPEKTFAFQCRKMGVLKKLQSKLKDPVVLFVSSLELSLLLKKNPNPERLSSHLAKKGISGISAKGRNFIDKSFVKSFQNKGLTFYIWTINPMDRIQHYTALGVDGVITDDPRQMNKK
jgi:glycerophosphoryl diester phosphodiesterase